jgi:hypothetical protein
MDMPSKPDKVMPIPWRYIVDGGRNVHVVRLGKPPRTMCDVRLTDPIFADNWSEDGLIMGHVTLTGFDATCNGCRVAIGFAALPPETRS